MLFEFQKICIKRKKYTKSTPVKDFPSIAKQNATQNVLHVVATQKPSIAT